MCFADGDNLSQLLHKVDKKLKANRLVFKAIVG